MIRDLRSSFVGCAGEEFEDLEGGWRESDSLPLGEADREGWVDATEESKADGAELEFWFMGFDMDD